MTNYLAQFQAIKNASDRIVVAVQLLLEALD
ncbi:hypothetical protein ZOSMA_9G01580 [Zostera marina]|uniref:Uncharacterized protein n=1 Tax=Zostera marina TaxID=29655 RepID=A0A0K9NH27_ZOSMR|nr:hypothetical protein ZOSMA_9G01580 [Zostera marina]